MSFKGSSVWKADVFVEQREQHADAVRQMPQPQFIRHPNGDWILFGAQDVRGGKPQYNFALQRLKCDKQVRVRVGCRYYTLPQAWKHWSKKSIRGVTSHQRNEGRQALAIIKLMILQAQAYGLLSVYTSVPFNSSIVKRKRR